MLFRSVACRELQPFQPARQRHHAAGGELVGRREIGEPRRALALAQYRHGHAVRIDRHRLHVAVSCLVGEVWVLLGRRGLCRAWSARSWFCVLVSEVWVLRFGRRGSRSGFFFFFFLNMGFCSGGILVGSGQWWHGGSAVVMTGQWRRGDRG